MKNKYFPLLVTCYSLLLFISGCTTIPTEDRDKSYYIGGARYFSLNELCNLNKINWTYDEIGETATLKKEGHIIKIMPESNIVLFDDNPVTLDRQVIVQGSQLLVPVSFKAEILDKFFYEKREEFTQIDKFLASKRVVIDPGHGGKDPGAIARGGLYEKDVILDIAKMLKEELRKRGIQVVMTRNTDKFVPLERRTEILNENRADLFISIHANSNHRKSLSGVEVYYLTNNVNDSLLAKEASFETNVYVNGNSLDIRSQTLRAILWDMLYTNNRMEAARLAKFICKNLTFCTGLRSAQVKQANFSVLRLALTPSVLVEVAYLSNKNDENRLNNSVFKEQIAKGLALAIVEFFKSQKQEYN